MVGQPGVELRRRRAGARDQRTATGRRRSCQRQGHDRGHGTQRDGAVDGAPHLALRHDVRPAADGTRRDRAPRRRLRPAQRAHCQRHVVRGHRRSRRLQCARPELERRPAFAGHRRARHGRDARLARHRAWHAARPVIAGTARLRHFDYGGVQVASFDAEADIDSSDTASLEHRLQRQHDRSRGAGVRLRPRQPQRLRRRPQDHARLRLARRSRSPHHRIPWRIRRRRRLRPGAQRVDRRPVAGRHQVPRRRCPPDPAGGAGARPFAAALGPAVPAHGPGRTTVHRRRTSPAAAFVARALQRGGLAAAAHPALAARLARVRRPAAGQRLGGEVAGQGMGRRDDAARARTDDQRAAQQVPRRAHPARQQPLRPAGRADADPREPEHRHRRSDEDRGRGAGAASLGRGARLDTERAHQGHVRSDQGAAAAGAGDRPGGRPARRQHPARRHGRPADVQWRLPGSRRRAGALSHQPQDHGAAGRRLVRRRRAQVRCAGRHRQGQADDRRQLHAGRKAS